MKNKIPPPVLLVLTGTIMWLVARSAINFPIEIPYSAFLSIALGVVGLLIDVLALHQFKVAQTTVNPLKPENATSLVQSGVFSRSRNPMYVGLVLILTGWAVWLGSASNIVVILIFILTITQLQIKPEEKALQVLFGDAYTNYCQSVRRWI